MPQCDDNLQVLHHPTHSLPLSAEHLPTEFPDYPLYIHIIRRGRISNEGTVYVERLEIIPHQCNAIDSPILSTFKKYKHVF